MGVVSLAQPETDADPISFDDAWDLYPKHVAKKDARRVWDRLSPTQHQAVVVALVLWRAVWADKEVQYVPHFSTWLGGERWEDEIPNEYRRTSASHEAFAPSIPAERGVMPEHVRLLLAKLRERK